jgi:hypothetical protein
VEQRSGTRWTRVGADPLDDHRLRAALGDTPDWRDHYRTLIAAIASVESSSA